jgi:hypothetical protein
MELGIYAHPWDLRALSAHGGLQRLSDLGFRDVALAVSYHAGRWLTPWQNDSKVRFLEDGTVHYRPRADYGKLAPLVSSEVRDGEPSPLEWLCEHAPKHGLRARAWAVHGSGADELTLAGSAEVLEVDSAGVRALSVDPEGLGFGGAPVEALRGGGRAVNARLLEGILAGEVCGAPLDVVLLNSAAGFVVAGLAHDLPEGVLRAREAVASGAARSKLNALRGFAAASP